MPDCRHLRVFSGVPQVLMTKTIPTSGFLTVGVNSMNPEWFAGRLRQLREANGLTQQELASKAGLKLGGIQNLESGRRLPGWKTALALAEALGVSVEEF